MEENMCSCKITEKKLITIQELQVYASIGKNRAYQLARDSGAIVRNGSRVLVNRTRLDEYLDCITE